MRIFPLSNYYVLSVSPDAEKFLSGLTTNTTTAEQNACIDKFGRIVATFWQEKINDNEIHLILDKRAAAPLLEHVKKHLALTNTKIQRKAALHVYYDLENRKVILSAEKWESNANENNAKAVVSEEEFTQFRLQNNIPLQFVDFTNEMILNVSYDFVSFTKGCYLGQEVVARVHHLGKPPKKLVAEMEKKRFVFVDTTLG